MLKLLLIALSVAFTAGAQASDKLKDGDKPLPATKYCVSYPAALVTHQWIQPRLNRMGDCSAANQNCSRDPLFPYRNFIGTWKGALWMGFIKIPITLHIYDKP